MKVARRNLGDGEVLTGRGWGNMESWDVVNKTKVYEMVI